VREWLRWAGWFLLILPLAGLACLVGFQATGMDVSSTPVGIALSATAIGSVLCTTGWVLLTHVRSLDAADRDLELVMRAWAGDTSAVPPVPGPASRLGDLLTWALAFVWFGFLRWEASDLFLLSIP